MAVTWKKLAIEDEVLLITGATTGATVQAQAFTNGVVAPYIAPAGDSTTSVQIRKADKSTAVLTVNTTDSNVGVGVTPAAGIRFAGYYSESNNSTDMYAGKFDVARTTTGTTNSTYGIRGEMDIRGSGTVGGEQYGLRYVASGSLSSGSIATMIGAGITVETIGSGTFTDARGMLIAGTGAANGTTLRGIRIALAQSGTWTTIYGLEIANVPTATNRYAIYTNTGPVRFGDTAILANSTAPSTSPADLTQLYSVDQDGTAGNAGLHIRSETGAIHSFGSYANVPGLIVNESGANTAAADLRAESDTEANMLWLDASADALYLGGSTNGLKVAKGGIVSLIGSAIRSPASGGAGAAGEICWDANYIYVCTAANTWKRAALTGGY